METTNNEDKKTKEYHRLYMQKRRMLGADKWNDRQKTLRASKKFEISEEEKERWQEDLANVLQLKKIIFKLQSKRPTELQQLFQSLSLSLLHLSSSNSSSI